ncbi:uncharacterized protein LOC117342866 [Pecten maximus]|uniref:uncharacterized protein LOC117342866 n=1 Tax=Pecten maximus TaxID=6579 RepID=UPI00145836DA|nr:uncharacterized protein LOC117342866 [Pecten maximus]
MEVSNIKKVLRTHRMESAKAKIDFADISTFDIVPTPPKEPKPEANRMHRRRGIRAQKSKTYEAKPASLQEFEAQELGLKHDTRSESNDLARTGPSDTNNPWYCQTPKTRDTSFKKNTCKDMKTTFVDQTTNASLKDVLKNTNPIRYPTPGPRDQLAPSPFPVNKNKLAPVVDPKKNAVPKTARPGPRPVKAIHTPVFNPSLIATAPDRQARTPLPEAMNNPNPIRYPAPGPRDKLAPSPFPVNKNKLVHVLDPRKNAVTKTTRVGLRLVKAVRVSIYSDNTESSCILTQMYSDRDDYANSIVPAMENSRPIRYPPPGPREQMLPNPFPVNKACLPPLIKHGRVVAPMCG